MIGQVSEDCYADICDECIDPGCACNCHLPETDQEDLNWWPDDE